MTELDPYLAALDRCIEALEREVGVSVRDLPPLGITDLLTSYGADFARKAADRQELWAAAWTSAFNRALDELVGTLTVVYTPH